MLWVLAAAAWAGKWDGQSLDVEVTRDVAVPKAQLVPMLSDWRTWQARFPCASEWELQANTSGLDARARALFEIGPKRKRFVTVFRTANENEIKWEADGRTGWFTQATFGATTDTTTSVTLRTPLTAPKWPIKGIAFTKVKPAWEQCYADFLGNLASGPVAGAGN
jgi:hypothetical protein